MKPTSKEKYIGIEIEFLSNKDMYTIMDYLEDQGYDSNISITEDGSIQEDYTTKKEYSSFSKMYYDQRVNLNYGVELRILATESELAYWLEIADKVIKKFKGKVNDSCGLHVHLDMRNRPVVKAIERLHKKQEQMFKMQPSSRRSSKFCKPETLEVLMSRYTKKVDIRYAAINTSAYHTHKTIEIRVHDGTVDIKEINNWVKYLISVVDSLPIDLQYVKSRIQKYA